jgi:hypothetical protein
MRASRLRRKSKIRFVALSYLPLRSPDAAHGEWRIAAIRNDEAASPLCANHATVPVAKGRTPPRSWAISRRMLDCRDWSLRNCEHAIETRDLEDLPD